MAGAGPWARRHIATIQAEEGLVLAGIVSRSLARDGGDVPAGVLPSAIWPDPTAMLNSGVRPDGAVVATEPGRHEALCTHLIGARIPVLVEKPLTLSAAGAERLRGLAQTAGVPAMVDLIYLFSHGYRELKRLLPRIGDLRLIRTTGGNRGPFRAYLSALWDFGPHDIAIALDLAGCDPIRVAASIVDGDARRHVVHVQLTFASGVSADLTFGNLMPERRRSVECEGTLGRLSWVDGSTGELRLDGTPVALSGPAPLDTALREFADCIGTGEDRGGTMDLACRINRILETVGADLGIEPGAGG